MPPRRKPPMADRTGSPERKARESGAAARAHGQATGAARLASVPKAAARGWDRALLIAACAGVVLLYTCGAIRCIWGADFWWQFRTGRLVAASGPPSVDTLSYTAAGNPWIETRWLYCWILYRLVSIGGFPAAILAKWALGAAAYGLVTWAALTRGGSHEDPSAGPESRAARGRPIPPRLGAMDSVQHDTGLGFVACAVLVAALLASSQRLFVRPEMVSYAFAALFLWAILRFRTLNSRAVWMLPFVTVVWANMHSLSALAPIMTAALFVVSLAEAVDRRAEATEVRAFAWRRARVTGLVFTGTALALAATPYLLHGLSLQLQLLTEIHGTVFKEAIPEFRSPFTFTQSYVAVAWWEVLIGLSILSGLANLRRLEPFLTLVLLCQLYLSATSIRNIPLFATAAIPFILWNLRQSPLAERWRARRQAPNAVRVLGAAVCAVAAVVSLDLVTDRFNVRQNDSNQFGLGLARHTFADGAVAFMREHKLEDPVFNTMFEGAYLLESDIRPFIDPRLEVYGDPAFRRYFRMQDEQAEWDAVSKQLDFRTALVDAQSRFVQRLVTSGGWELVYLDDVAAVFAREGHLGSARPIRLPEDQARVIEGVRRTLPVPAAYSVFRFARVVSPLPYLRVATFFIRLGRADLAETFARDALTAWPPAQGAHELLGQIRSAQGDHADAIVEYEAELAAAPSQPLPTRRMLALEYFAAGRREDAMRALEALTVELPHDHIAWAALTKLYAEAGRSADAVRCAQTCVALAPRNAEYRKNLGRSQALAGDRRAGASTLATAFRLDPSDVSVAADLVSLSLQLGDANKAREYLQRGLAQKPDDPELMKMAAHIHGAG